MPPGNDGCRQPADLVITDILLPDKDGVETIFEFYRDFPGAKIVAISGGGKMRAEDCVEVARAIPNVKRAFKKPFAMDEMLRAVKEILGE